MPCGEAGDRTPWELLPKDIKERSTGLFEASEGVSIMGLQNIRPSDIFNVYTVGRSSKVCDFIVPRVRSEGRKSTRVENEDDKPPKRCWNGAML